MGPPRLNRCTADHGAAEGQRGGLFLATIDFHDQLDIDSMDVLNVVIAVHERTASTFPKADGPKLSTLAGGIGHLEQRQSTP